MDHVNIDKLIGRTINDYHLIREIGRGSNGIVYLARQEILDRDVAFKVLLPEWVSSPGYLENFMREAKLAAKLDHPHIVQALEAGNTPEGIHYFVMEYVPGPTVEDIRTETPERLSLKFILELSIQLTDALAYGWNAQHLIHGDIKPSNLLVRSGDDALKLADLGLARIGSAQLAPGDVMATPMYAAPEVISGTAPVTFSSDIYSFGVMFYELTAGAAPFRGDMESLLQSHLYEAPTPLIEANPDLDRDLSLFVDRMLKKTPEERPAAWEEVRDFLQRVYDRLYPALAKPVAAAPEAGKTPPRREWPDKKHPGIRTEDPRWERRLRIGIFLLLSLSLIFFCVMLFMFRS